MIFDVAAAYAERRLTIGRIISEHAGRFGDKIFLRNLDDGRLFSYRDLDVITNRLANAFLSLGCGRGSHVAMVMDNCPEFLFVCYALNKIGAVAAPINTAAHGKLLAYYLNLSDAMLVVTQGALVGNVLAVVGDAPAVRKVVVIGEVPAAIDYSGELVEDYAALLQSSSETAPDIEVSFNDMAYLMFSSGTTGPSKASMHSHVSSINGGFAAVRAQSLAPSDVFYSPLPLFHIGGIFMGANAVLIAGATMALPARFSVNNFWRDVKRSGATVANTIGAMLAFMWNEPASPDDRNHHLRLVGTAPMPQFARDFEKRFGAPIYVAYGLSDFGYACHLKSTDPQSKWASSGRPVEGVQLKIFDDDDMETPTGKTGEIVLRSEWSWGAAHGYYKDPAQTVAAWRNLWLHTGDLGYLDADGFMYFAGRKKDAIRRRGENISAFEIEQALTRHPAIAEVAAFPVSSEYTEEEVAIAIVFRSGAGIEMTDLIDYCQKNMAYFMVPRFVQVLSGLPRTGTQRVEKYKLREAAERDRESLWDREKAGIVVRR